MVLGVFDKNVHIILNSKPTRKNCESRKFPFKPQFDLADKKEIEEEERKKRISGWNKAVRYAYGWAKEEE